MAGGAEVILAGRSSDTAIFAALPEMRGIPSGIAWHAAKILECGAASVVQRRTPDCMFAWVRKDHFVVEAPDPSLRCTPQILGAFQEAQWHVEHVVTRELNASTDNPLVFPDTGMVIHCGNFYGQQISMVSDYLRFGLIKMALLAERQIERLVNWRYSRGLPPMLAGLTLHRDRLRQACERGFPTATEAAASSSARPCR